MQTNQPNSAKQLNSTQQLITQHLGIWTSAETEKKSGRGRAGGIAGSVYGIKKLRELILELAVRGKLVPQNANDEPASELLKRIQAEKTKLIAEGKLKKEKPLAPIGDDEKSFELPKRWSWVRVANLAEIKGGKRLPEGKTFSPAKTPHIYIQVTNMKNGTVIEESLKYIDGDTRELLKNYTISSQDLYITIAGTIGDVGTVPTNFNNMILTENAAKIIFKELDKIWFKYCFASNFLREQFQEKTIQSAQPKLALHRVASSVIALPPLAEQHRIVAKVDALMALCDQLENQHLNAAEAHETLVSELLATLTQSQDAADFNANWQRIYVYFDVLFTTQASIAVLKQTVLQLAVMGKLVPQDQNDEPASELLKRIQAEKTKLIAQDKLKKEKLLAPIAEDEKPFEVPQGWEWTRLLTAAIINPRNSANDELEASFVPMTLIGTQFNESHNHEIRIWKDIKQGFTHFQEGDIGVAKITPCFENSKACVFNGLKNKIGAGTTELHIVRPLVETLNPRYVLAYLKSPRFLYIGESKMTGTAGQKRLPKEIVESNPFPLPPVTEQNRIVAKVDALMALCDQLKTRIQQANQQQQTIANALVAQAVAA